MHLYTFANWRKSIELSPIGENPLNFSQYSYGLSPIIGESLVGEEQNSQSSNHYRDFILAKRSIGWL
jgi:hypothetical protein